MYQFFLLVAQERPKKEIDPPRWFYPYQNTCAFTLSDSLELHFFFVLKHSLRFFGVTFNIKTRDTVASNYINQKNGKCDKLNISKTAVSLYSSTWLKQRAGRKLLYDYQHKVTNSQQKNLRTCRKTNSRTKWKSRYETK